MKLLTIAFQTFNRKKFLEANLNSLIKQIKKYQLENEVVIFIGDDKSDDGTLDLIKKYSKKYKFIDYYFNTKNLGLPANTFKIIDKSPSNQYLWLLSDDDYLKEGKLIKIISFLKKNQPDVLYLNYQLVKTFLKPKLKFKPIKSIIGPSWRLNKDVFLSSRKEFFSFIANIGFYNLRMILAQQSIPIVKAKILKKNLQLLTNSSYNLNKEFYPFDLTLYINLPEKFIFLKEKLVQITTNNRSWNFDILKANEVVKNYFNPLQKMILKKYSRLMTLKLKLLLKFSIFYTNLVPLIYKLAVFLGLKKQIYQAQFGDEK